jgi:hypothetical protein
MAAATAVRPNLGGKPLDKLSLAKQEFFNQPEGFPYEGFDPDQVVLPPDDDCGVPSEDDEAPEEHLQDEETGFSTSIGASLLWPFTRAMWASAQLGSSSTACVHQCPGLLSFQR